MHDVNFVGMDTMQFSQKLNLTRMDKDEIKELRKERMTKSERFREQSAAFLRGPLLFGLPLLLSMVMLIVLVIIYIVRPYALTRDFTRTKCEVKSYKILNGTLASCSAGTDPFQPCIKVQVSYPTATEERSGVIMENEQALVNCNPCSYTFGQHGLLHQYQDACENWRENFNPTDCVDDFISNYAVVGSAYTCYFNPHNPDQIVRNLTLDLNLLIHTFSWPVLACLSYLLAWAFVSYDSKQLGLLDSCIIDEIIYQRKKQEISRIQANEWKKRKLSQTLGVLNCTENGRNGGVSSFVGTIDGHTKQLSSSMPSLSNLALGQVMTSTGHLSQSVDFSESINDLPFDIVGNDDDDYEDGNFDLRHLDLAVSQQNINDLTTTYEYLHTNEGEYFSGCLNMPAGRSHQTLPNTTTGLWTTARNNNQKYRKWNIVSNGTLPNGHLSFSPLDDNQYVFHNQYSNTFTQNVQTTKQQTNGTGPLPPKPPMRTFCNNSNSVQNDTIVSEDEIDFYYTVVNRQAQARNVSSDKVEGMQIVNMFTANDESKV